MRRGGRLPAREIHMLGRKFFDSGTGRAATVIAALLLCAVSTTASARHHSHQDASEHDSDAPRGVAGEFDYYLLTLSWSPTYCLTHGDDREQCGRKGYGFVLHGLWPQYLRGGYPQNCDSDLGLTPQAADFARSIYPSPRLIAHEWRRHGVCSGLDALAYFRTADRARTSIRIPGLLEAPPAPQQLTAASLAEAVRAVNPTLPERGLVVACSRGELAELRICLGRDLQPVTCGRGVRNSCPASPFEVPASR
jgi:ribonuclease T2